MAYIKGSTDVANAAADLYGILSGTVSGGQRGNGQIGNGVTAGVSAWTGIDATYKVVRSTETMQPFRLPIQCYRGMPRFEYNSVAGDPGGSATYDMQKGKPTYSGIYTGTATNVFFTSYVTTINTNVGFLTGLVVTYTEENADSGASIKGATTVSGWTGITSTQLLNDGVSLTLTLQPTDILTTTAEPLWIRSYGTSYPDGIDYIPEIAKYIGTGMSIGIASGSTNDYTATTDYTTARWVRLHETLQCHGQNRPYNWGGNGHSIGLHWVVGGTPPAVGATYWINDMSMYSVYGMVQAGKTYSANTGWSIDFAPLDYWDEINARGRNPLNSATHAFAPSITGGYDSYEWNNDTNPVFTIGLPVSTTYINYWISVKSDKVCILTRGDLSSSGLISFSTLQKYITPYPTIDKYNWVSARTYGTTPWYNSWVSTYSAGEAVYSLPYYGPAYSQTTVENGSASGVMSQVMWSHGSEPYQVNSKPFVPANTSTPLGNPSQMDNKWKFYTIKFGGAFYGTTPSTGLYSYYTDNGLLGTLQGVYVLSSTGWNTLDELVDGTNVYILAASVGFRGNMTYLAMLQE